MKMTKNENYATPDMEVIELVVEQAVLTDSFGTDAPDFGYGGDFSN